MNVHFSQYQYQRSKYFKHHEENYESIRQTLKAVGKHLRNSILKDHKSCIHRLCSLMKMPGEEFLEVCPFAYTYLQWKKNIFNTNPFYNELGCISKSKPENYIFPCLHFQEILLNLLAIIINNYSDINELTVRWILSKIAGFLSLNHFFDLLILNSNSNLTNSSFTPKTEENLPFFVITLENFSTMYVWVRSKNISINWIKSIKCPCLNTILRRKQESNVSHLPLILAINNAPEEEQKRVNNFLKILGFYKGY